MTRLLRQHLLPLGFPALQRAPQASLSSQSSLLRADSAQRLRRDLPSLPGSLEQRFSPASSRPGLFSQARDLSLATESFFPAPLSAPQLLIPRRGFSLSASAFALCPPFLRDRRNAGLPALSALRALFCSRVTSRRDVGDQLDNAEHGLGRSPISGSYRSGSDLGPSPSASALADR